MDTINCLHETMDSNQINYDKIELDAFFQVNKFALDQVEKCDVQMFMKIQLRLYTYDWCGGVEGLFLITQMNLSKKKTVMSYFGNTQFKILSRSSV